MRLLEYLLYPTFAGRVRFYLILAVLAPLLFNDYVLAASLALMGAPALISVAAFYLICYLPLLDWPYAAWRCTGNIAIAAAWLGVATILPFGVPWAVNMKLAQPTANLPLQLPEHPISAANILLVGEGGLADVNSCGNFCQTLLWSGATDHLLARQSVGNAEHLAQATLFTVEKSNQCQPLQRNSPSPAPRDGLCIASRSVVTPSFDAEIEVYGSIGPLRYEPLGEEHRGARSLKIYDCHTTCDNIIAQATEESTVRLAIPLNLHFEGGLDTGGPFGFFLARYPQTITPTANTLRATFNWNIGTFSPKPGFDGNVSHGGPATPDFYAMQQREAQESTRRENEELHKVMGPYLPGDKGYAEYEKKLRDSKAQHKECSSFIFTSGQDPKFVRCFPGP